MLSRKLTIDHIPKAIKGKRILMRVDFNVPVKEGVITDATRIVKTLPTIKYCLDNGAKAVIMMSHRGRPKGQRHDDMTMAPIVPVFEELMGQELNFLDDCVGSDVEKACGAADGGKLILLENLRFHLAEEGKGVVNGEKVKAGNDEINAFRSSLTK